MVVRLIQVIRIRTHRLISLLVALGVCASFIPVPIGIKSAGNKHHSTPFPCQNHPCGCNSAEQCWKKCCCFNHAEKLAWAKRHGVTPPSFVMALAQPAAAEQHPSSSCSNAPSKRPCCEAANSSSDDAHPARPQPHGGSGYVLAVFIQKCQGHSFYWHSLPWALPVGSEMISCFWLLPTAWHRPVSAIGSSRTLEPPEPPPRIPLPLSHRSV